MFHHNSKEMPKDLFAKETNSSLSLASEWMNDIKKPHLAVMPVNHNRNQRDKITLRMQ